MLDENYINEIKDDHTTVFQIPNERVEEVKTNDQQGESELTNTESWNDLLASIAAREAAILLRTQELEADMTTLLQTGPAYSDTLFFPSQFDLNSSKGPSATNSQSLLTTTNSDDNISPSLAANSNNDFIKPRKPKSSPLANNTEINENEFAILSDNNGDENATIEPHKSDDGAAVFTRLESNTDSIIR